MGKNFIKALITSSDLAKPKAASNKTDKKAKTARMAGFTLVELLVSMAILGVVLTIAFSLFSGSNQLISVDTKRVTSGREAQAALDLMVADIRQAGENLDRLASIGKQEGVKDFLVSGIDIYTSPIDTENYNASITVRKVVSDFQGKDAVDNKGIASIAPMPICGVAGTIITVADDKTGAGSVPGCNYAPYSSNEDTVPYPDDTTLASWRHLFKLRKNLPQTALVYRTDNAKAIINRVTINRVLDAEFIRSNIDPSKVVRRLGKIEMANNLPSGYGVRAGRILPIDERVYEIRDGDLVLIEGAGNATPQTLLFNVKSLKIVARTKDAPDGLTQTPQIGSADSSNMWKNLKGIDIEIQTWRDSKRKKIGATYKASVMPRNVESSQ